MAAGVVEDPTRKFISLVRLPGTAWKGPNIRPVPG